MLFFRVASMLNKFYRQSYRNVLCIIKLFPKLYRKVYNLQFPKKSVADSDPTAHENG